MTEPLPRLLAAAKRVLGRKLFAVERSEWQARIRNGGEPTKLENPLAPFASIKKQAPTVTFAMSSQPYAGTAGFHIVRFDPQDAPKVFNTDSYDEVSLPSLPEWPRILATARITTAEANYFLARFVFLEGPKKRSDHHSANIPDDIDGAKPK